MALAMRIHAALAAAALAVGIGAGPAAALDYVETPTLARTHGDVDLPPVAERLPDVPLVADFAATKQTLGRHGGDLDTIIGRAKDIRLINVWGYARLVGYNTSFELVPDILQSVDVEEGRIFTFHLRPGHKWSDGAPFTAEDFRFWWEDVANNPKLNPNGPATFMRVDDALPEFEVIDEVTVRFTWKGVNAVFLPTLAQARPPFIYRPAHYLKQFHVRYADPEELRKKVEEINARNWAALFNGKDEMYRANNPDLPSLQPWVPTKAPSDRRFIMVRNPYYHRVDPAGRQLPYIDRVIISVANGRLIPAKAQAGESMLQARDLAFSDITVLKSGEKTAGYDTRLWPISKGAQLVLYPNLTVKDPVWRKLNRDVRFRRALSLGIDRRMINRVLYFGFATEGNNTVLPMSPLFEEYYQTAWAHYDPVVANELLDEIGLTERRGDGIRLLPDGRPLEIIVESAGESQAEIDALELVRETLTDIGVKIFVKPSQRDVVRNRALAGQLVMGISSGYDNGVPTAEMPPADFAPTTLESFNWSAWGAYHESQGREGEAVDYPPARELIEEYVLWRHSTSHEERQAIWERMLQIHADQVFNIGIVTMARQPVVVSERLRNVPEEGIYGWDPGAQYGIHRMDAFWIDDAKKTAERD
ncbi:peptide/nickel transport system substrate-binding protein [Rhodobium orientis]|uniref:Peptide ABC transporter substrate-binding protein n=3 Tax=Rhodobium orientis TaxID=34017 RepID=A0A327JK28_9HYPH|nr:ABC transporter substrate-binding protein [Rhodobium orientis]MBB4305070.1 peptide/nickel transport system substrate-binding protein [Rhodobium orientis]RAI25643.1 peptide ABC transporter substrate-binding protein [Rhodobium orientis]